MNLSQTPPPDFILRQIEQAIKHKIDEDVEVVAERAKQEVISRIRGLVASSAGRVLENFSFARIDCDLIITVKFAFPEKK